MKKEIDIKETIKRISEQVFVAVLIQLALYGLVFIHSYFNKEKLDITVCSSTKNNNGYYTGINIKNYQNDKSINSITIWCDTKLDVSFLNYKDIEVYDDKIVLKNIPPLYDGTIIFNSQEMINNKNIRFETEEKRTVDFLSEKKEKVVSFWKNVVVDILVYTIIYVIMALIIDKITKAKIERFNQRLIEKEEKMNDIMKEHKELKEKLEKFRDENKELSMSFLKVKIFLHRRLSDYSKELNFYRQLLKKIVSKDNEKEKEDICYKITRELKTFKTLEKINMEDLEVDSLKLSKIEEDEIKSEIKDNK